MVCPSASLRVGLWARPLEAVRALQGVFSALLALVSFQGVRGAYSWEWVSCALEVVARCPSLVEEALSSSLAEGRVEEVAGDYAHARANGLRAIPLLFEVFGGWSPEVEAVFGDAVFARSNKLTAHEYEETTWSARTWMTFVMQRISVAVQKAVAKEVSDALGFLGDPRD